jgi:dTMP kinase
MKKHRGIFIAFEGIDGCGKSTQAKKLCACLKKKGYSVMLLREPGGTPVSEKIRRILLDRRLDISPLTELFLYEAARSQLAESVIIPALDKRQVVISDRYFDSTMAYQGYGRGIDIRLVERLNRAASLGIEPDMIFILDVDYGTSLARRSKRPDRLEKEKKAFFNRVRGGFRSLASKRMTTLIDGRKDIDSIFDEVRARTMRLIRDRGIGGAG